MLACKTLFSSLFSPQSLFIQIPANRKDPLAKDIFNAIKEYVDSDIGGYEGKGRAIALFKRCESVKDEDFKLFIETNIKNELDTSKKLCSILIDIYNKHSLLSNSFAKSVSDTLIEYLNRGFDGQNNIRSAGIERAVRLLKRNLNKNDDEIQFLVEEDIFIGLDTSITCRAFLKTTYLQFYQLKIMPYDFRYWVFKTIQLYIQNHEGGFDGIGEENATLLKRDFAALERERQYADKIWELISVKGSGTRLRTKLGYLLCTYLGIRRDEVSYYHNNMYAADPVTGQPISEINAIYLTIVQLKPVETWPEKDIYPNSRVKKPSSTTRMPTAPISIVGHFGSQERSSESASYPNSFKNPFPPAESYSPKPRG